MVHEELRDKIKKAMGGKVHPDARDTWADFLRSRGTEYFINYDWVKHNGFYRWIYDCEDVDFGDGSQGVSVWIVRHGRVGHDADDQAQEGTG